MAKITKDYVEFYITNVCNLNCDNCNRLNNYHFSGHESWQDLADVYEQWSHKIDFNRISILGGEPTLHPDLHLWIQGIRNFWPRANLRLITNGTRLDYVHERGLFDLLALTDTLLEINLHNRSRYPAITAKIQNYLDDPVITVVPNPGVSWLDAYNLVKDASWPQCHDHDDFGSLPVSVQIECTEVHAIDPPTFFRNTGELHMIDRRGIRVHVRYYENFRTAPLRYAGTDTFAVYDSDPEAAHAVCLSSRCTHMMQGRMYKCHHMALLPVFAQQYNVDITAEQQHLLQSYKPLTSDHTVPQMQEFVDQLPVAIPQCRLCPSHIDEIFIQSSTAKPRVQKRTIPIKYQH